MSDYEPLDLSNLTNLGPQTLPLAEDGGPLHLMGSAPFKYAVPGSDVELEGPVPVGPQTMRGIPFVVGSPDGSDGDLYVAAGGEHGGVSIPIGSAARRVIFAHAVLESTIAEDGWWGTDVADYVFRLAGGREERVAVRERFEIGTLPGVGQIPGGHSQFLAVTDQYDKPMDRYEGQWGRAGWRQLETRGDPIERYWLWAWLNPDPDALIESVEIVPRGPGLIIAGVTLGHADEEPFAREGMRPARVVLTRDEDADQPFDLEVDVDRGRAKYPYALPRQPADDFLAAPYTGWGEAQNEKASPAYVEIGAIPSATVTVKQAGKTVGSVRWGDVERDGSAEGDGVRLDLLDRGKNWVKVVIVDEDTGEPVPCRVHFRSPEGVPYQPYGHHNHVNSNLDTFNFDLGGDIRLGQITYAYVDGRCEGWLPRGEVIVDIAAGFEYNPLRERIHIEPGQRELVIKLKRWVDMNGGGWYSGDPHMHFISAIGALLDARSEGVNIAHVEQTQLGSLFAGVDEFTGYPFSTRDGKHIVSVCQENRQNMMSHLLLLGITDPILPFTSDGQGEGGLGGTMDTTLTYWADECHAQGGTVISAHFWGFSREVVVLVATGRLDGLEFKGHQRQYTHEEYYRLLNCGYRIPVLGGTDKMDNSTPVGFYRTYVKMREGEEFDFDTWCSNLRRGRTFMTAGPILHFSIDGHEIGDTVEIDGPGKVSVDAWAESVVPIHRLDLLKNGEIIASAESEEGARRLDLKLDVDIDAHSWLAVRSGSPTYYGDPDYDDLPRGIYSHTSPIYVACGGDWWMFDRDVAAHMLNIIEGDLVYIRQTAGQLPADRVTHRHGDDDHIEYLSRPFIEAREAIHERMRELGVSL